MTTATVLRAWLAVPAVLLLGCGAPTSHATHTTAGEQVRTPARVHAGPMLGHVTHREATIWLQLDAPAAVDIRWRSLDDGEIGRSRVHEATDASYGTATIPVPGLEPGTRYVYDVFIDGERVVPVNPQEFVTQPLWQWRTDPPAFRMAIGSCMYVNEPAYDRPGRPYGGELEILGSLLEADPDLMLWLGDNTYLREVDWGSRDGMAYRYTHDRALPELQPLLPAFAHYATWDDHDFGPNNSDRTFPLRGDSLELFELFWANPAYGQPDLPGVFTSFQWADVDVFLLDDRYHRSSNDAPEAERTILGDEQLTWLLDALSTSAAPFKIVALGNQALNPNTAYEGLVHVPSEYDRLLSGIVDRRIEGVVFVSGDRHHSELITVTPEGGYPLYDFTSSPLTAGAGDARYELDNPARVDGTLVVGERSFGLIDVFGPRDERVMRLSARGVDGTERWRVEIAAADLTFPDDE